MAVILSFPTTIQPVPNVLDLACRLKSKKLIRYLYQCHFSDPVAFYLFKKKIGYGFNIKWILEYDLYTGDRIGEPNWDTVPMQNEIKDLIKGAYYSYVNRVRVSVDYISLACYEPHLRRAIFQTTKDRQLFAIVKKISYCEKSIGFKIF